MPAILKPKIKPSVMPGKAPAPAAEAPEPSPAPAPKATAQAAATTTKPKLSFIKRGAEAKAAMAQEERKVELRKNQLYRFWLPSDASTSITFLDGQLSDGILDIPYFHEHQVQLNGSWKNWFICTQDEEPCPICEGGLSASYVGIFTIIDHSKYTSSRDNKVHKDEPKLFVAKRDTIKLLQLAAQKRGGLRGCTFDVSRVGEKAPGVGSAFDFTEKLTEQQLVAKYKERAKPVDYDKYLAATYQSADELRKLGFGVMGKPVGGEDGAGKDYDM